MKDRIVAGLYIRVSTQEQASEGYSIDEQRERLTKYAEAQDWSIYRVYADPGFSGGSTDRPGLRSLIADVSAGKINKVVVYKLDRLSRSQKDTLYLIEDVFIPAKVDFVSMTENFDTGTPLGRAMIGILSVFAQLEREQIKERMSLGREGRAKSGLFHGSNRYPIGYDYIDGQLVINPYEAEIVKRIYREFNSGKTKTSIASQLQREGITTHFGKITAGTVHSVITNKIAIGIIVHNGTEYPGQHEAIISREEYDRAALRLKRQAETDENHYNFQKHISPLTGLCYCPYCKKKMIIQHKGRRRKDGSIGRVITCYHRSLTGCPNPRYDLETVEEYIIGQIKKLRLDPEYFRSTRSKTQTAGDMERIEIMEERIRGNETKISRLMDLYTIGGIDLASVKEKIETYNLEITTLRSEIDRIKETLSEEITDEEIKDLAGMIEDEDPERVRAICKALIDRIEFDGNDVAVYWTF